MRKRKLNIPSCDDICYFPDDRIFDISCDDDLMNEVLEYASGIQYLNDCVSLVFKFPVGELYSSRFDAYVTMPPRIYMKFQNYKGKIYLSQYGSHNQIICNAHNVQMFRSTSTEDIMETDYVTYNANILIEDGPMVKINNI